VLKNGVREVIRIVALGGRGLSGCGAVAKAGKAKSAAEGREKGRALAGNTPWGTKEKGRDERRGGEPAPSHGENRSGTGKRGGKVAESFRGEWGEGKNGIGIYETGHPRGREPK